MLYTQKGVHHLNLVSCGCGDKGKVAAVPMSSTTWFPRQRQDGGCSLQLALPSLGLRQWQTMTDKSQKSWIVCTGLPIFSPDCCALLIQFHVAPTLQTAPPCSTWLDSSPFGLAQLELGSLLLLRALQILPTPPLLFSTVFWSCILVEQEGDGEHRICVSQGWSRQSPPVKRGRQNDALPRVLSFSFPPKPRSPSDEVCGIEQQPGHAHTAPKFHPLSATRMAQYAEIC